MDLRRNIRLYFIEHSIPLIFYIGLIIVIILGMKGLNHLLKEKKNTSEEIVSSQQEEAKTNKEYEKTLEEFITLCKKEEIEETFSMLSSECKAKLYPTVNIFESEFINQNFESKEDIEISNTEDPTIYTIDILEDSLTSGKLEGRTAKKKIYCKLMEENKGIKIYIDYNN